MKRALVIVAVALFAGGGVLASLGAGDGPAGKTYDIVFDNAFGLVKGAEFKVGGVPVGSIKDLDVERRDARARVTVEVTEGTGFGGLRQGATCMIAPQSLIGEYFVDCQPGKTGELLESGATIPVRQTQSPIPPDLVVNVMRRPVRERFAIVFNELGAGLAARGDDLNETIRRAIPALTATNQVLDILGDNRDTLRALARDSGRVLKVLGERRRDVGRFVTAAKDTATATADRRAELAETFRRFPGFLDQLTPTMTDLGTAARLQTPALADLRAAATSVTRLLATLEPFSRASDRSLTSLGDAARTGRTAAAEAKSLVSLLGTLGRRAPEPANNLAILFNDLDDRSRAVEKDPDSPTGAGYTGLEAPLQYIFDQSLAANIFDQRGYSLKLNLTVGECSDYKTAADVLAEPEVYARCGQPLGPNQPGITTPDPSPPLTRRAKTRKRSKPTASERDGERPTRPAATPAPDAPAAATPGPAPVPTVAPLLAPVQKLLDELPKRVLDPLEPVLSGGKDSGGSSAQDLLDFLLAP